MAYLKAIVEGSEEGPQNRRLANYFEANGYTKITKVKMGVNLSFFENDFWTVKCQNTILCSLFDGLYQNIPTPSGSNGGPLDVYYYIA